MAAERRWALALAVLLAGGAASACRDVGRPPPPARVVSVAAASDLKFALDDLVARFRAGHPNVEVRVTYGSSGNFYAQIANGAPFDLYFSADIEYPRRLVADGHARGETLSTYAIGRLVLWAPAGAEVDPAALGLAALRDPAVRTLAIANPRHAPYGRAAEAVLRGAGAWDSVEGRLVLGENVAQTAQFVESGAADLGLIAASLASAPTLRDRGRAWTVPAALHPPLEQGAVVLGRARDPAAAESLLAFVTGPTGREVLRACGFDMPD